MTYVRSRVMYTAQETPTKRSSTVLTCKCLTMVDVYNYALLLTITITDFIASEGVIHLCCQLRMVGTCN